MSGAFSLFGVLILLSVFGVLVLLDLSVCRVLARFVFRILAVLVFCHSVVLLNRDDTIISKNAVFIQKEVLEKGIFLNISETISVFRRLL